MPRAFTHLTQQINFSLYKNTLTIYPKSPNVASVQLTDKSPLQIQQALSEIIQFEKCQQRKVKSAVDLMAKELGVKRYVHREDNDHSCYHQDDFDLGHTHYHAQFAVTMTVQLLNKILRVFEKHKLITHQERLNFIKAYHQANVLPPKESRKKLPKVIVLEYGSIAAKASASVEMLKFLEKKFERQLEAFDKKVAAFEKASQKNPKKYQLAYEAAKTLHETLSEQYTNYQQQKDVTAFIIKANAAIHDARGELENHRGVKEYFNDCIAFFSGLIDQVKGTYTQDANRKLTFFKTDSIQKLDGLSETVQQFSLNA